MEAQANDDDAEEQTDVLQSDQQLSSVELGKLVLSQVQAEFTKWNTIDCHQVLRSLSGPSTWPMSHDPGILRFLRPASVATASLEPQFDRQTVLSEESPTPLLVSQEVYSPEGAIIETSSVELKVIYPSLYLDPYPQYESCSPLSRPVFKGDDSDDMNFIPYSDDHKFDHHSHTLHYGSFSWQNTFDPDMEVIVLEAAYRLHTRYALTYEEIEKCDILPLKLHSQPGKPGLLSTVHRRDRFDWPGNTISSSFSFKHPAQPERSDLRSRLQSLNAIFCPSLSCIEPLCSVHVESNPMPVPQKAKLSLSRILAQVMTPCKNQCFLENEVIQGSSTWNASDLDTFKLILEISPEITPCDLATLCFKPCNEVLQYRKLLYSGNPTESPADGSNEPAADDIILTRRAPTFNDNNPTYFTPNDPCNHAGPCSGTSGCLCFNNRSHCQRNCHCGAECIRRWRGCRCSRIKSKWSCATERCPCVEAFRECDPELCTNCRCTTDDNTSCRNSQIQRGAHKEVEVKRSLWGLGAFLAEAAKAGDLISEYVGELIYEPTVESRADLATHRERCYVFGVNDTFSLDATYLGNSTKFIDHGGTERNRRVNCHAQGMISFPAWPCPPARCRLSSPGQRRPPDWYIRYSGHRGGFGGLDELWLAVLYRMNGLIANRPYVRSTATHQMDRRILTTVA